MKYRKGKVGLDSHENLGRNLILLSLYMYHKCVPWDRTLTLEEQSLPRGLQGSIPPHAEGASGFHPFPHGRDSRARSLHMPKNSRASPLPSRKGLHRYTLHEGISGLNPSTCRGSSRASPLTSRRGLQGSIPPHAEGAPGLHP